MAPWLSFEADTGVFPIVSVNKDMEGVSFSEYRLLATLSRAVKRTETLCLQVSATCALVLRGSTSSVIQKSCAQH